MKPFERSAWRSVRWLLLLGCAGGVLAAEEGWVSSINLGFISARHWYSSTAAEDAADLSAVVNSQVDLGPKASMSMGGLINGLLFERPAGRWALDSRAGESQSSLSRRLVEFDQINQISGGDNFAAYHMPASFAPVLRTLASSTAGPSAPTASGTWTSNASGNWGTAGNWSGGVVADGAGNTARFDTLNVTTDVTVTLDTSRTIGHVFVGDTDGSHRYTIASTGGSSLTFDSADQFVHSVLQQSSTSGGATISAPIFVKNDLDINNMSTTNQLNIAGDIASSGPASSFQSIWFNFATGATGNISVTGNITNGMTGASLGLVVVNGGTVVLTGTNTYTGSTSVDGGTLLINGNNSGATGAVFVGSGGTLGGVGTVGGSVFTFDGTITGATAGSVGTLTLTSNVNLATGEGGGTYWADLSGNMSDLLAIAGTLNLGSGSILDIHGVGDGVTTYTLATFASRTGDLGAMFDTVMGIPNGYDLVYHDMNIQLVPIPEPSTWIGGALALAMLAFTQRRRFRRA